MRQEVSGKSTGCDETKEKEMKLDHGRHLSFPNAFDGVCGGVEENYLGECELTGKGCGIQ